MRNYVAKTWDRNLVICKIHTLLLVYLRGQVYNYLILTFFE